jgi:hypothetical protein
MGWKFLGLWGLFFFVPTIYAETCAESAIAIAPQTPRSFPEDLSRACYQGGRCTVFALANVTHEPVLKVAREYADMLDRSGEAPSVFSMEQYLREKTQLNLELTAKELNADRIHQLLFDEAPQEKEGKFVYVVVYDDHVQTISRGEVSNPAQFYEPDSALARQGLADQPLGEKRKYLERGISLWGPVRYIMKYKVGAAARP